MSYLRKVSSQFTEVRADILPNTFLLLTMDVAELTLPNGMVVYHHSKSVGKWQERDAISTYNEIYRDELYLHDGFFKLDDLTKTVFDCGANIGLFSLWAAQRCPKAKIFAFEPIPHTFDMLKRNVARHGFDDRHQLYHVGLAEIPLNGKPHDREVNFRFYPEFSAISTCLWEEQEQIHILTAPTEDNDLQIFERFETVECKIRCLSDIIKEEGVSEIDYLKIDVEGNELDVINGLYRDDWNKIQQVCAEVQSTNGKIEKFKKILKDSGFEVSLTNAKAEWLGHGIKMIYGRRPEYRK